MQDYYEILGVKRTATTSQIKVAYRNLAKKHHPDLIGSSPSTDDHFKQIVSAHETLKDPKKRIKYDLTSIIPLTADKVDLKRQANFAYKHMSAYVGDMLSKQLKNFQQKLSQKKGQDIRHTMAISLAQLYAHATLNIRIQKNLACTDCQGTGIAEAIQSEFEAVPCKICDGSSLIQRSTSFQFTIPKGYEPESTLSFPSQGSAGAFGGTSGDLIVKLAVAHDPVFEKYESDLKYPQSVKITDLIFGKSLKIQLPDGKRTEITIPPGTQPSKIFQLSNLGFYHKNGLHRGKLLIPLHVAIPTRIPQNVKDAIHALQKDLPGF